MPDDRIPSDVELLSRLRARLGDAVVEALLDAGTLTPAPLQPSLHVLVNALLAWEPDLPASPAPSDIQRVEPRQFFSQNVPSAVELLGGETVLEHPDAVGAALDALARRVYPAFLAASGVRSHHPGFPIRLRGLPLYDAAVAAMRSDAQFARLWAGDSVSTSFGHGEHWLRLNDPAELLLHGSWRLCLLRGRWTARGFRDALRSQLDTVRAALAGGTARAPLFFGFGDARVEGETADGDCVVRPYHGSLQSSLFHEEDRLDKQGGGFLIERLVPWSFAVSGEQQDAQLPPLLSSKDFDAFRHWADCLAVALACSGGGADRIRPHHFQTPRALPGRPELRWVVNADPFYNAVSHHFSQGWRGDSSAKLVAIDAKVLARTRSFEAIQDGPTRVAIGRISASLEHPRRWRDGLVDAIIAWEAMSGDCTDAVSMKVSAVIGRLISDPAHAKQVRAEVRNLYGVRSRVLHGGDVGVSAVHRDAAVCVALVALRRLVDDHADLIGESARFEKLFLDPKAAPVQ